jgi:hypothetical protein
MGLYISLFDIIENYFASLTVPESQARVGVGRGVLCKLILVLRHLPCKEMLFLRIESGNSPLEPMGVNHFSPRLKLCKEVDEEPMME